MKNVKFVVVVAVLLAALAFLVISIRHNLTAHGEVKFHKELPVSVSGLEYKAPRTAENEFISRTYEVYADTFTVQTQPPMVVSRYILTKAPSPLHDLLNKEMAAVVNTGQSGGIEYGNMRIFELGEYRCIKGLYLIPCKRWNEVGSISEDMHEPKNNPMLSARFLVSLAVIFGALGTDNTDLQTLIDSPDIRKILADPLLLQGYLQIFARVQ